MRCIALSLSPQWMSLSRLALVEQQLNLPFLRPGVAALPRTLQSSPAPRRQPTLRRLRHCPPVRINLQAQDPTLVRTRSFRLVYRNGAEVKQLVAIMRRSVARFAQLEVAVTLGAGLSSATHSPLLVEWRRCAWRAQPRRRSATADQSARTLPTIVAAAGGSSVSASGVCWTTQWPSC